MATEPASPLPVPQNPEHKTLVLSDPPPEEHHALLVSLCVAAVALVTGGMVAAYWQVTSPAAETPETVKEEIAK